MMAPFRFFEVHPLSGPGGLRRLKMNVPKDEPGYCNCLAECGGQERLLKSGAQYIKHMVKEAHRQLLLDPALQELNMNTAAQSSEEAAFTDSQLYRTVPDATINEDIYWRADDDYVKVWSSPPPPGSRASSVAPVSDKEESARPHAWDSPPLEIGPPTPMWEFDHALREDSYYQALPPPMPITNPQLHDFLSEWPFPIVNTVANPAATATLTALHVPRSVALSVLKSTLCFTKLIVAKCGYARGAAIQAEGAPPSPPGGAAEASSNEVADLATELIGDCRVSFQSVEKRLGLGVPLICHPVCSNGECQEVYHQFLTKDSARSAVGINCSACGTDIREDGRPEGELKCTWFPRIPLKYALERILAHPGIEEACLSWKSRRNAPSEYDDLPEGLKIYRDQYDSSYWDSILSPSGERITQIDQGNVLYEAIAEARRAHEEREAHQRLAVESLRVNWATIRNNHPGARKPPPYKPKPFLKKTSDVITSSFRGEKGNLSPMMLLPYTDRFLASTFDVMHNLFLGNDKNFFQKGLVRGDYDQEQNMPSASGAPENQPRAEAEHRSSSRNQGDADVARGSRNEGAYGEFGEDVIGRNQSALEDEENEGSASEDDLDEENLGPHQDPPIPATAPSREQEQEAPSAS
ncbi:hypothetical protein NCC49_004516 [Naganishia albida]|nr:hypothetical protein NCC49_004516 [Naganishia albida]